MKKILAVIILGILCFTGNCKTLVGVGNLRLEMKVNPEGIGVTSPRFSWEITANKPDILQTAYHLQVASTTEQLNSEKELLWDSGKIQSDRSMYVPYSGKALESGKTYVWRVKVETNQGESVWSDVATWSMALLRRKEWKSMWIGRDDLTNDGESIGGKDRKTRLAARYLRKEFTAQKDIKRAVLYICGLGAYEAYMNGERIGKDVLAPTVSAYTKTVYYNTYDITKYMSKGQNTIGVINGNGRFFSVRNPQMLMYGIPRTLAQIEMEYTDGTTSTVISDWNWKCACHGPIISNNEYDGEEYDARLELEGWNKNGFDDSKWDIAYAMDAPDGKLVAQPNPNIRVMESLSPVSIAEQPDGKYILDMGQNMVGWLNIKLRGKKGQPVVMRFAELLQKDGSLYVKNLRSASATDTYIPAKDGEFEWQPSFVYHGFRYVEISGLDYQPELSSFRGDVIYDDMLTTGQFCCSNPLVNQIFKNAYWGIRGNYRGMPTDCPQRDERQGWLGDRATGAYGEAYIFDNSRLYDKWMQDIEDAMRSDGSIPDVCPPFWPFYNNSVTWPSAFIYVADMLYRQYGDDHAIRTHYAAMKRWLDFLRENYMVDDILTHDTYGDWCMPPEHENLIHSQDPARKTDGAILSTTVYYDLLHKMAQFARIAGHDEDEAAYMKLASQIRDAYNTRFFNKETAQYANNTVTANILSLHLGLVPEGYEQRVADNIVKKTEEDFKGHVSVGVVGIQHLMRGLTESGHLDLAYKILTNEDYPSWGYMIKNGATTIWELWNGNTADPSMNSGNHVMLLGDLIIWYYENLAGIKCAPDAAGFKRILMQPWFPTGLDEVNASYKSVYGDIKSAWSKKKGYFRWNITVPCNTTAVVRIPNEYDVKVNSKRGIHKITKTDKYLELEVGSGSYCFTN